MRVHGLPAPPFAGMTRIRFVRSEAVQPPSQPGASGLPRVRATATLVRAADRPEGRPHRAGGRGDTRAAGVTPANAVTLCQRSRHAVLRRTRPAVLELTG
ncbi:hypothetical protein GCM10010507_45750 [Streptomyces cinnamoneus]|uniref:Uncharacterized protein n=1 Tax=Streptomyces cinnamoneus TaxID=53446 RepID=A0A918WNJ0_STRCJ|nr:hypothetical protein GCM10010507_45750 [Streptomyces cinnamoneus]